MIDINHTVVSDFGLFEVKFNIKRSGSNQVLYTAVVYVVGKQGIAEPEIYQTAEAAARSWGAFADPNDRFAVDHHFYDRKFEPVSINRIGQVDGIAKRDAEFLADNAPKLGWD